MQAREAPRKPRPKETGLDLGVCIRGQMGPEGLRPWRPTNAGRAMKRVPRLKWFRGSASLSDGAGLDLGGAVATVGWPTALSDDGQGAAPDAPTINDRSTPQVQRRSVGQHSIEQPEHVGIRVRAPAEQDDARLAGLVERQKPRIVEIGGDDDSASRRAASSNWMSEARASPI
jgi:hypothetical protein